MFSLKTVFRRMIETSTKSAWWTVLFKLGSIVMRIILMILIIVIASVIASSTATWSMKATAMATATSTSIIGCVKAEKPKNTIPFRVYYVYLFRERGTGNGTYLYSKILHCDIKLPHKIGLSSHLQPIPQRHLRKGIEFNLKDKRAEWLMAQLMKLYQQYLSCVRRCFCFSS